MGLTFYRCHWDLSSHIHIIRNQSLLVLSMPWKKGILTSCAAGNNGPYRREISNFFPWALTVAASTIDRRFVTKVVLGNGQVFLVCLLSVLILKFHKFGTLSKINTYLFLTSFEKINGLHLIVSISVQLHTPWCTRETQAMSHLALILISLGSAMLELSIQPLPREEFFYVILLMMDR